MNEEVIIPERVKKPRAKKQPSLSETSKVAKYYMNIKRGMKKGEAALRAGYADKAHTSAIEKTDTFKALSIRDSLLNQITHDELSNELLKNVRQDDDKGAKNKAIELAMDRIEPQGAPMRESEKVLIILKG